MVNYYTGESFFYIQQTGFYQSKALFDNDIKIAADV